MSASPARPDTHVPFDHAPSFFVIGAQKAGTTRLCHLLSSHPEVSIPTKEPFYFQDAVSMAEKRNWYRSLFSNATDGSIFGEGSTYYSMCDTFPGTARRIHDFNPNAHIIYMVRHPLRRIESAWFQLLSVREISGLDSFNRAVVRSDALIEPTLYWKQLSAYRECFADEQIHIETFEDFIRDERLTVARCLSFLGVDAGEPLAVGDVEARNESTGKLQPWAAVDVLKSVPGYQSMKRIVPEQWRISLGGRLQKPISRTPEWDARLLRYVLERVEEDARRLLEHLSLPQDFWDMTDAAIP